MTDATLLPFAAAALIAIAMTAAAALRGWREWLSLREEQVRSGRRPAAARDANEVAALRARIRRLEAIADGADF